VGKPWPKGVPRGPMSTEQRKLLSDIMRGRKASPETRAKMSASHQGVLRGRAQRPEVVAARVEARRGVPPTPAQSASALVAQVLAVAARAAKRSPIVMRDGMAWRICRKCNELKPARKATPSSPTKDGYRVTCLDCSGHMLREAKRRASKRASGRGVTAEEWRAILAAFGHHCAYCGAGGRMTMDHVVPLSRNGEHAPSNVVPACRSCNSRKNTKTPEEWGRVPRAVRATTPSTEETNP